MNHLDEISDLLHVLPDFLSHEICDEIIEYSESNPSIFYNRNKTNVNYGINGDVGEYYAAEVSDNCSRRLWRKHFKHLEFDGVSLSEVQINRYNKGAFIPPHNDRNGLFTFHTICIPLQTNDDNCLIFGDPDVYHNNINIEEAHKAGRIEIFRDKKGYGYHFEGTKPIHWVPAVTTNRYSLVLIF